MSLSGRSTEFLVLNQYTAVTVSTVVFSGCWQKHWIIRSGSIKRKKIWYQSIRCYRQSSSDDADDDTSEKMDEIDAIDAVNTDASGTIDGIDADESGMID